MPPFRNVIGAVPAAMLRRTLSGVGDGRPAWVEALELPGDAGWAGPGSAQWQVHGSLASLVGGIRALVLQTMHPLALAGVLQHSSFRTDPLGRLQRTGQFVSMTTFGTSEQAQAAVDTVLRVHETVTGVAPDGRPYAANDPHLLLWVHLALTDSFLVAHEAYGPGTVDGDAYVAEMAVVADAMGIPGPPRDRAELAAAMEAFRPELRADRDTRDVAAFLLVPPLPLPVQPAYQVLLGSAIDLLPRWCRREIGLWRRPAPVRMANHAATATMLGGLRAALGPAGPAEQAARQRLGLREAS